MSTRFRLNRERNRDVWVENIMAPAEVTAEELFPLEAHVYSQADTSAEVEIKHGDKTLGTKKVQLVRGLNRVAFETSIKDEAGPVIIDAEVKAAGRSVSGEQQVSILDRRSRPAQDPVRRRPSAKRAISPDGADDRRSDRKHGDAASIPKTIEELDAYDAIILSDVARNSLSDQQMKTLATYVRDLGGGFILCGRRK